MVADLNIGVEAWVRFPVRSNQTQCRQRLATASTFYRRFHGIGGSTLCLIWPVRQTPLRTSWAASYVSNQYANRSVCRDLILKKLCTFVAFSNAFSWRHIWVKLKHQFQYSADTCKFLFVQNPNLNFSILPVLKWPWMCRDYSAVITSIPTF